MVLTVQMSGRVPAHAEAETTVIRLGRTRDRTPLLVGLIAAGVSIASTYYYLPHQLVLRYQDSFSHLQISRRVLSRASPGSAQPGRVSLPVTQLLHGLL